MRHVVVGAGLAGVTAVETLRQRDGSAEIVMVGDEAGPPYARMALPDLLAGQVEEPGVFIHRDPEHLGRLQVRHIHGRVERVQTEQHRLHLTDGTVLSYDRLLIATGSRPAASDAEGFDLPGVHHCWTLEQARGLMAAAKAGRRAILLGAGFIACALLEALVQRGLKVTVVEQTEQLLPQMLDATAAALVRRRCAELGVRVLTSTAVKRIRAGGGVALWVQLDGGGELPADLAVVATGVQANVELLQGSGIETETGVLVDRTLRTSSPDVYAAGEVAQGPELHGRSSSVVAVQPTAAEHGRIAAVNMTNGDLSYQGSLNMNVLDTFNLTTCSVGRWRNGGDRATAFDEGRYRYLLLRLADDRVAGAVTVGWDRDLGALRGLIQSRVRLGPWRDRLLRDPKRFMEASVAVGAPGATA